MAFCNSDKVKLAQVMLNGEALPWVSKAKHIDNILHDSGSTDQPKKGIWSEEASRLNSSWNKNVKILFDLP